MRRKILVKFFLAKVFLFICTIADGHISDIKTIGTEYPTLQALNAQGVTEPGVLFIFLQVILKLLPTPTAFVVTSNLNGG